MATQKPMQTPYMERLMKQAQERKKKKEEAEKPSMSKAKGRRGGVAPAPKATAPATAPAPKAKAPATAPKSTSAPKGRKLDKNGNPIITKEELEKSGLSLRDFLNKERGLTRRADKPKAALKPVKSQAEFRAEQDKMAAKKKAIADKAKRETKK